jgi:tetratricopeptide (TPR) repeat protein
MGAIYLAGEKYSEAQTQYQKAVELSRAIGNRKGEAAALRGLGDAAWALGRYDPAAKHYESAQQIASRIGDGPGEAAFIRDRGDAAWAKEDYELAAELYQDALDRSMACDDRWGEADGNRKLGNIAWKTEDLGEAAHLYRKAWDLYRQLGARRLEAECLVVLGRLPVASADKEFVYGDNPEEDRKAYTAEAVRMLTSIKAMSRAGEVSSDATLEQLIQGLYSIHGRHVDRPEHRVL